MKATISEMMTADFRTVTAKSAKLPVSVPTVVLDADGEPCKIAAGNSIYPAVVLPSGTTLADLATSGRLIRTVTRTVPGVVILDEGRVVGFVPRETLVQALLLHTGFRSGDDTGSDPLLHGDPRPVSGAVRIRCLTCRTINAYDFYLPGDQKTCMQGHPLDPDLD